jgi:hypothetical protein
MDEEADGIFIGEAEASVMVPEEKMGTRTFPVHVELVDFDRVSEWADACPDFAEWIGIDDNLRTVTIEGRRYVLFITPYS